MSWLKNSFLQANKPKDSIIGILKKNLGGAREGRDRSVVHASDITKVDFCPRQWAFLDQQAKKSSIEFLSTALDVTFQMGSQAERLVVENWGGQSVIGNWRCRHCNEQRSITTKPNGCCDPSGKMPHWWEYLQVHIDSPVYAVEGGIDALFDVGTPLWVITEIKTIKHEDFDSLLVPLPEHRIRTNLYMKLVETSHFPWRMKINTSEARVLYISRGHGRMHPNWNEILPFKEFTIKRDDESLKDTLKRATQLKIWREEGKMPAGICSTAMDKYAKVCDCCKLCFSGHYPAQQEKLV